MELQWFSEGKNKVRPTCKETVLALYIVLPSPWWNAEMYALDGWIRPFLRINCGWKVSIYLYSTFTMHYMQHKHIRNRDIKKENNNKNDCINFKFKSWGEQRQDGST